MKSTPKPAQEIQKICIDALDSIKAQNIVSLEVSGLTAITGYMIIATGTSCAHVRSLLNHLKITLKSHNIEIIGIEGQDTAQWVLCDAAEVVVHIMLEETREYYGLEKIWSVKACTSA